MFQAKILFFIVVFIFLSVLTMAQPIHVLCTTYPVYLFTQNITLGTPCQVELLIDAHFGCPHNYSLMPKDMRKLARADVLIINGLGLEDFLGSSLSKTNPKLVTIISTQGILESEHNSEIDKESEHNSEPKKDHICDADCLHTDPAHTEHQHTHIDPHLFTHPRFAILMVQNIAQGLARYDPKHSAIYEQNARNYIADLQKLCDQIQQMASTFQDRQIIIQHKTWSYLAKDLKLDVVGIVQEFSGTEPSAYQMRLLIQTIQQYKAKVIFIEPQYSDKTARRIAESTQIAVATLDSIVTGPQNPPLDYYQITMQKNFTVLQNILGTQKEK